MRGLCPRPPGIYRFAVKTTGPGDGAAAPGCSHTRVGAPVASPHCRILRSGNCILNPLLGDNSRNYTLELTRAKYQL